MVLGRPIWDAGVNHELHRLTQYRRTGAEGLGLPCFSKSCLLVQSKRRWMARCDAEPQGAQSNASGPRNHGIRQKPTDAPPSVFRGYPDLEKMSDGWFVLIAAAPRKADGPVADERDDRNLSVCSRALGEAVAPLCVGADGLALVGASKRVRRVRQCA
jgi:hypothetical protein